MSVLVAALVLAWVCLILLVLAMAGMLRQIRELQADVAELTPRGRRPLVGTQLEALASGTRTVLLVLTPGCGFCEVAYRMVAEFAATRPQHRVEVLSHRAVDWFTDPSLPVRVDERLFAELDVPWAPAVLVVDASGTVVTARPIGSEEALREQLGELPDTAEPLGERS